MSFSQQFFGPFSTDKRQLVNLPLPHGCIELGFTDSLGGILGLSWTTRGDVWSITTLLHDWLKAARRSQRDFQRETQTIHARCVWGQSPYPDIYAITFGDSTLQYETEVRFCHGSELLTGWYQVRGIK